MINLYESMGQDRTQDPCFSDQTRNKLHYGARFIYSMNA